MITADTSVLVAGYLRNHRFHSQAARGLAQVRDGGLLLGHTMAETYAVLTAPGGPYDAPAATVVSYLERLLAGEPAWLRGARYADALRELADAGIDGGVVYDGLIALAARDAGARLLSLDRRAADTYARVGVDFELVA